MKILFKGGIDKCSKLRHGYETENQKKARRAETIPRVLFVSDAQTAVALTEYLIYLISSKY